MKKVYNIPTTGIAIVGMVTNLCAVSEHPTLGIGEGNTTEPAF